MVFSDAMQSPHICCYLVVNCVKFREHDPINELLTTAGYCSAHFSQCMISQRLLSQSAHVHQLQSSNTTWISQAEFHSINHKQSVVYRASVGEMHLVELLQLVNAIVTY